MTMKRGILVPDGVGCLDQEYLNSTVVEHYQTEALRDERVSQLLALGRHPTKSFSGVTRGLGLTDVYTLRWEEPRGEELDALRTSS